MERCIYDATGRCVRTVHDAWASYGEKNGHALGPSSAFDIYQTFYTAVAGLVGFMVIWQLTSRMFGRARMYGGLRSVGAVLFSLLLSVAGGTFCGQLAGDLYRYGRVDFRAAAIETNHQVAHYFRQIPSGALGVVVTIRNIAIGR
jgi:hypothetical protein